MALFVAIGIILMMAFTLADASPTPRSYPGNDCRLHVTGVYLPCADVSPTSYPEHWVQMGIEV